MATPAIAPGPNLLLLPLFPEPADVSKGRMTSTFSLIVLSFHAHGQTEKFWRS
jgi:hypothetical protein